MIVKREDVIASDFGVGKIVAITKNFIIHLVEDGEEVVVTKGVDPFWIPIEMEGIDVPDNELEIKN